MTSTLEDKTICSTDKSACSTIFFFYMWAIGGEEASFGYKSHVCAFI